MIKVLLLLIILSPINAAEISKTKDQDCSQGQCIPRILRKLKLLGELYRVECLPKNIKPEEIEDYHKETPLTEQCWKYITKINDLDEKLTVQQLHLDAQTNCESGNCKQPDSNGHIFTNVEELLKIKPDNACTEKKKARIRKNCPDDLKCVLMSAAMLGAGGYIAEAIVPKDYLPKKCHLGDDACATKLAMSFLDSAFHFFSGIADLSKMAFNGFWNWISKSEDHSSTSQLALAKASEDPSVFKELVSDFPGAMKKIFSAFVAYTTEWLQEDVFCRKWSGLPHVGKCLRPLTDFNCLNCKEAVTGVLCSLPGTVIAEIVPAFISGGLTSALKHGASGSSKLVKAIKVSKTGTKLAKMASPIKTLAKGSSPLAASARAYQSSKLRSTLKTSFQALKKLAATTKTYITTSSTNKAIVFSKNAIHKSAKVVLIGLDNPATVMAYKAGHHSFDRLMKLGKPVERAIVKKPLNVTRGSMMVLSPSMHGANETEKIKKKEEEKKEIKKALK